VLLALLVHLVGVVLDQGLAEPVDTPQGRAQVVADRVGEGLQFPVSRFELGGALADALFEFGVEPMDGLLGLLALGDIVDAGQDTGPLPNLIMLAENEPVMILPLFVWN
jgi:hypothetical protein